MAYGGLYTLVVLYTDNVTYTEVSAYNCILVNPLPCTFEVDSYRVSLLQQGIKPFNQIKDYYTRHPAIMIEYVS